MLKFTFPDGSVREYESGITGLQVAESIFPALARNVISCALNGETTELNRPITEDASFHCINLRTRKDSIASDILVHTFWQRPCRNCILDFSLTLVLQSRVLSVLDVKVKGTLVA